MFNITSRICSDVILMLWNSLIGLSRHTIKQENYFGNFFTVGDNAIYMNNFYPGMTKKKLKRILHVYDDFCWQIGLDN